MVQRIREIHVPSITAIQFGAVIRWRRLIKEMCCVCGGGDGDDRSNLNPIAGGLITTSLVHGSRRRGVLGSCGSCEESCMDTWQETVEWSRSRRSCTQTLATVGSCSEIRCTRSLGQFWRWIKMKSRGLYMRTTLGDEWRGRSRLYRMDATSTYKLKMEDSCMSRRICSPSLLLSFSSLCCLSFVFSFSLFRRSFHCFLSQTLNDDQTQRWVASNFAKFEAIAASHLEKMWYIGWWLWKRME